MPGSTCGNRMIMRLYFLLLLLLSPVFTLKLRAENIQPLHPFITTGEEAFQPGQTVNWHTLVKVFRLQKDQLSLKQAENKKVVAAILTLTLGMLGVHRIYLGTKPWIPAVYLFTFGGGFFILPLIDLIMILSSKDISAFEQNPRVFMWIKPEEPLKNE